MAKVLKKADLEADYYSTSFYDVFTQKTYSIEDKKKYKVGVHTDKTLGQREYKHVYPADQEWKDMDAFIAENGFTPKEAMYLRQGLGFQLSIKECYEFYLDRQKGDHPERLRLRNLDVDIL